uniref:Uncharacterized protein n=1 Tax=Utricularia reniformis TaxID=192314 RepID=A0A1Y0B419_9LAMI|nr:hypothetical protein AEK19_MT1999 [Utricularia reniformis]ART32161.1 hypothetical protein AEK19_MT1999 [Utricularia reniformis]
MYSRKMRAHYTSRRSKLMSTIVGRVLNLNYLTYSFQQLRVGAYQAPPRKRASPVPKQIPFPFSRVPNSIFRAGLSPSQDN